MYYIFVEGVDPCGEGVRAQLYSFGTFAEAEAFWQQSLKDDEPVKDLTEMKMFTGSMLKHYQLNEAADSPESGLTDGDLRVSTLDDVPDPDKENV